MTPTPDINAVEMAQDRANGRGVLVQAEGPVGAVMAAPLEAVVPDYLLDGGEVVHFALKPSLWWIPLDSARWLAASVLLILAANFGPLTIYSWYLYQGAFVACAVRLAWATLQWVSRLYILTNRRVMRLRGVFRVELFECPLQRIQNTVLTMTIGERLTRTGSITIETASSGLGSAEWRIIARPLDVHQRLCEAIDRARHSR